MGWTPTACTCVPAARPRDDQALSSHRYKRRTERAATASTNNPSQKEKDELVRTLTFSAKSAMIGVFGVVGARCLAVLLSLTFQGDSQMEHPYLYFCILLWLVPTVFWLKRMNWALSQFNPSLVIPVLQLCWIMFSTTLGGIYFGEFEQFAGVQRGLGDGKSIKS